MTEVGVIWQKWVWYGKGGCDLMEFLGSLIYYHLMFT